LRLVLLRLVFLRLRLVFLRLRLEAILSNWTHEKILVKNIEWKPSG